MKAASRNETAEAYLDRIAALADGHMKSSKVVDRDAEVQALIRSMKQTGLTLVLGGKNLGKTFLKGDAIDAKRAKGTLTSFQWICGMLLGKPLMTALDLQQVSEVGNCGTGDAARGVLLQYKQ